MRIVLAGTPQISLKAFENIIDQFNVVAIITQPDRKSGRGMRFQETPVAKLGRDNNIKVFKPHKIINIYNELKDIDYDLLISFAYGQYIPTKILSLGKYKPLNIHGSLLPKYRGASPIHQAILNGDQEIGITLIEMVEEMDAGDMYFKASKKIDNKKTTGDAFKIISNLAAENIINWIKDIEKNRTKPQKQPNDFSVAPKIKKTYGDLSTLESKMEAIRRVRGLNPFPGAFINIKGKRVKIFDVVETKVKNAIEIPFKDGNLYAIDFQWESKRRVRI